MAETTREMVVRLTMDAGGFKKTASEIDRQIKNIDKEIKSMGGDAGKSKLEEKLGLQQKAVENLQKAVDAARLKLQDADTDAKKLLAAKQLSGLETQLATAEQKAMALKNQLAAANYIKWGGMITGFGRAMQRMGQKFTMYVGAPLAALGISSFNAFKDYEMALARLKSALPEAGEEIERLNEAALNMSETIPVSYEEIMAIMTSLAKAGVPVGEIDGMTLALARMSAVTGMTAEEVGTSMVMFMNSMGLPMGNVDQLGAALVRLADESIATEGDIFSMATRMAATSNLAGLSATEVLSLAAAFASMGVDAEAGGSAASKLMKKMQLAAETGEGVEGFAKVMGVSAEQFTAGWNQSAADSMLAFFQGLSDMDASGQTSVLAMLDEMELTEIRLSNLIALGASNPDMFQNLMGTGAEGFEDNTALVEKAGTIFETTSGQMDMLANSTRNAQADLGENVADAFQPIIDKVGELVKKFGELDEETQTRWVNIGATLVGVGAGATLIGTAAKGVGEIVTYIGKLKSGEVTLFSKAIGALTSTGAGGWLAIAAASAGVLLLIDSLVNESVAIRESLSGIEITLDQASYDSTMSALAEVKAQADAISGEKGEYNKNVSAAVKAGYGTADMFGTALGYEARFTQAQMASIAGKYAEEIDKLNGMIGAETDKAKQASLAAQRDALQAKWDAETQATRASYTEAVSALVSGMMQAQPEAKAALEQAAKDYDLLAIIGDIEAEALAQDSGAGMIEVYKKLFTPENMDRFFQGKSFEDLIGMDPGKASMYAAQIQENLKRSMVDALQKNEDSGGLAFTLWQTILGDPMTAGMFDQTKTTGALDGIIEALDYKTAGETAGKGWADALTTGLADSITSGTTGLVVPAATTMAESLDQAVTGPLGIQSPSTVMMAHGLDVATGLHLGIIQGIPLVSGAMSALGAAITAIAAAQGAAAGAAYGRAFGNNASIQFSAAVAKIKREIDEMNIRIMRGYGGTP